MYKYFLVFVLLLLPALLPAKDIHADLSEAIKNNIVTVEATDVNGCYKGKCLQLKIVNQKNSMLILKVDQGMIFKPEDPVYQPLVLAGNETITIQANKSRTIDVQTFCGNSPKSCPAAGLRYTFSHLGSDTLVQVLRFIKTRQLFDQLGQEAVWVITNGHALNSVYDPARDAVSKQLIELLAKITGRAKPNYYAVGDMDETPGAPAFTAKTLKIYAVFEQILEAPKTLTLAVYNEEGVIIKPVFENQVFGRAGHRFNVEFESENVAAGNYSIRLKEGETVLQEKKVKVE